MSSAPSTPADSPKLAFDARGLLPVVVVDRLTGAVRMVAWANEEAVAQTRSTGRGTFFSRSRGALWVKGETSGHTLEVRRVLVDCDADCLVYEAEPSGPSCHTGAESCFFRALGSEGEGVAQTMLGRLEAVLVARKADTAQKSYTRSLYDGGAPKIGAKLREEADELARALESESDDRVVEEAADLLFHAMVGLEHRNLSYRRVLAALDRRFGTSGHDEKAARGPREG